MAVMAGDEAPPTALERRERRPTGTVLFLTALFALPIGTCGGIGATKARDGVREPVETTAAALSGDGAIEDGTYVSLDARVRHVATDELPIGDRLVIRAPGTSVYAVEGADLVFTAGPTRAFPPGEAVRLEGRLCPDDAPLTCPIDDYVKWFLRDAEKLAGHEARVVTIGQVPSDNLVEASGAPACRGTSSPRSTRFA
jgi:hypothetical protein